MIYFYCDSDRNINIYKPDFRVVFLALPSFNDIFECLVSPSWKAYKLSGKNYLLPLRLQNFYSAKPQKWNESTSFQRVQLGRGCGVFFSSFLRWRKAVWELRIPHLGYCLEQSRRNSALIFTRTGLSFWFRMALSFAEARTWVDGNVCCGEQSQTWKFPPWLPAAELMLFRVCLFLHVDTYHEIKNYSLIHKLHQPQYGSILVYFVFQYIELAKVAQLPHEDTVLTCNPYTSCICVKGRTILNTFF